ncbi:MAG: RluA family pseudouridine synthase [Elusimicrobiales bacterium]
MEADFKEIKKIYSGSGERVDIYLKSVLNGFSRQLIKAMIEKGYVKINRDVVKPSYILKSGDEITIVLNRENKKDFNLKDIIIYEDDDIIVLNKPAGLIVHPPGESWLTNPDALMFSQQSLALLLYSQSSISKSDVRRMGLVHRLDAETSGVMVVAKKFSIQRFLMEQFSSRSVDKNYKAVVCGVVSDDKIIIDAPIGRFSGDKRLRVMEYGRDAVTEISVIERGSKNSYLDVFPKTGRTNQIRIHLSYIGHPIVGDEVYGGKEYKRLMLHSYSIAFIHPSSKKYVRFKAEPDRDFENFISELLA